MKRITRTCLVAALLGISATATQVQAQSFWSGRKSGILHSGIFRKRSVPCEECCPDITPAVPAPETMTHPKEEPAPIPKVVPSQPSEPVTPPVPPTPPEPAPPTAPEAAPPESTPFDSQDLGSGLETAGSSDSLGTNMLGDFVGIIYKLPSDDVLDTAQKKARARILNRYKIADNTSPIPQTRLLYSYNYFSDAFDSTGDIHRNTFGAEIAMFDNLISVEVRQAIDSFRSFPDSKDTTSVANLRTVFKSVLYRERGFLASGGLGIGLPTGDNVQGTPDDNYILTPFVGYLYRAPGSRWFVQGFEQLDIPTDADDQILLHTDFGIGYWWYSPEDGGTILPGVTAIVPGFELHLYTPLGDAPTGQLSGLVYSDVLNSTWGTTFFFGRSTSLSLGMGIPLSSQKDYDFELQCHFQWLFGSSSPQPVSFSG